MDEKSISRAVIKRLPRYFRYLGELKDDGVERISSNDLAAKMKTSASQIRQDLNQFGGFGQQGYGYNVKYLYEEIGNILGLNKKHNLILIGAGNLGQALANYVNFEKRGFIIKGIFDKDTAKHGRLIRDIPISPMEEMEQFVKKNDIDIAILTIPKTEAVEAAKILVRYGIKGIWNFAHVDLNVPDDIIVENVHLSESLMELSYKLNSTITGKGE
ncbi:MAG: redox-sensing transcriptional repressor Rex [Lachnospiraceae bacterium]|nr:redox-sensing transcriptional repressor Rex [Lachnospiraceae bacterium]